MIGLKYCLIHLRKFLKINPQYLLKFLKMMVSYFHGNTGFLFSPHTHISDANKKSLWKGFPSGNTTHLFLHPSLACSSYFKQIFIFLHVISVWSAASIIKWILRSEAAVRNRDREFTVYEDFEAAVRGVHTGKTHKHMIVSTAHNSPVTVYMTEIYYYNFSHNAIHPSRCLMSASATLKALESFKIKHAFNLCVINTGEWTTYFITRMASSWHGATVIWQYDTLTSIYMFSRQCVHNCITPGEK